MSIASSRLLKKHFGYDSFRGSQENIIDSILAGHDTMAIMPTGAGKSICYQLPALLLPGITIVISPLISLMKDQVDSLNAAGIPATFINSSLSTAETAARLCSICHGGCRLLYVAPERLDSHEFQVVAATLAISLIAVDEAHCVSQWGHDFRPSYRKIAPFIAQLPTRPIISAFTATATTEVRQDIAALLELRHPAVFAASFDRPNLFFSVIKGQDKNRFILNYLQNTAASGIIYAATRKDTDLLWYMLRKKGYSAGHYHAGLSEKERTLMQDDFSFDRRQVMVATNAFGMGIDKSNVRFVIHYNMPKNMEAYYQEAGRAGRDGEPGDCILLFSPQDVQLQKYLIEKSALDDEAHKAHEYHQLQQMNDYCHTTRCLRHYILEYFGEAISSADCGRCSNCTDDREIRDITIAAQQIFSCILRTRERFGISIIAAILKGSHTKRLSELGFDKLSTYGLMHSLTLQAIKDIISLLAAEDYLTLSEGTYPVVNLTNKALDVLHGRLSVKQKLPKTAAPQITAAVDQSLLTILRQLRRQLAAAEGVPPFIIFSDSTLAAMAADKPHSLAELGTVKGIGEIKLQRYGKKFLEAILSGDKDNSNWLTANNVTYGQAPVPEKIPTVQSSSRPSHLTTLKLQRDGLSIGEIAATRHLKPLTVKEHLLRCAADGETIAWDNLIPSKQENPILETSNKLHTTRLKAIKKALPDDVEYITIRAVLTKYKLL